jgi:hypothetical protein
MKTQMLQYCKKIKIFASISLVVCGVASCQSMSTKAPLEAKVNRSYLSAANKANSSVKTRTNEHELSFFQLGRAMQQSLFNSFYYESWWNTKD